MTDIEKVSTLAGEKPEPELPERKYVMVKVGSSKCQKEFLVELDELLQEAPLFKDQLTSDMVVSSGELVIPDVTPRGFRNFLGYLTTGQISCSTLEECHETWEVARRYKVTQFDDLITACLSYLLSASNTCDMYNMAKRFGNAEVESMCLNELEEDTSEVIKSSSFKRAKVEIVEKIVSSEDINVSSELEVFTALVEWGKEEVTRRSLSPTPDSLRVVLEPLLKHIRFLEMTSEEFVLHVVPEQILTFQEERLLLIHLTVPNQRSVPFPKALGSYNIPRMGSNATDICLSTIVPDEIRAMTDTSSQVALVSGSGAFYLDDIVFPFKHEGDKFHATAQVVFEFNNPSNGKFARRIVSHGPITYTRGSYRYSCRLLKVREGERVSILADLVDFSPSLFRLQTTPIELPATLNLQGDTVIINVVACSVANPFTKVVVIC